MVRFEVFGGGDPKNPAVRLSHMHVHIIPIPSASLEPLITSFKSQAKDEGLLESKELPANQFWPFVRVLVSGGEEMIFTPPSKDGPSVPFNLDMARFVVAAALGIPERLDWKKCVMNVKGEETTTEALRKKYPLE